MQQKIIKNLKINMMIKTKISWR